MSFCTLQQVAEHTPYTPIEFSKFGIDEGSDVFRHFANAGDEVLVSLPSYGNRYITGKIKGMIFKHNPLVRARYTYDFISPEGNHYPGRIGQGAPVVFPPELFELQKKFLESRNIKNIQGSYSHSSFSTDSFEFYGYDVEIFSDLQKDLDLEITLFPCKYYRSSRFQITRTGQNCLIIPYVLVVQNISIRPLNSNCPSTIPIIRLPIKAGDRFKYKSVEEGGYYEVVVGFVSYVTSSTRGTSVFCVAKNLNKEWEHSIIQVGLYWGEGQYRYPDLYDGVYDDHLSCPSKPPVGFQLNQRIKRFTKLEDICYDPKLVAERTRQLLLKSFRGLQVVDIFGFQVPLKNQQTDEVTWVSPYFLLGKEFPKDMTFGMDSVMLILRNGTELHSFGGNCCNMPKMRDIISKTRPQDILSWSFSKVRASVLINGQKKFVQDKHKIQVKMGPIGFSQKKTYSGINIHNMKRAFVKVQGGKVLWQSIGTNEEYLYHMVMDNLNGKWDPRSKGIFPHKWYHDLMEILRGGQYDIIDKRMTDVFFMRYFLRDLTKKSLETPLERLVDTCLEIKHIVQELDKWNSDKSTPETYNMDVCDVCGRDECFCDE